jgi:hypothetical protein
MAQAGLTGYIRWTTHGLDSFGVVTATTNEGVACVGQSAEAG